MEEVFEPGSQSERCTAMEPSKSSKPQAVRNTSVMMLLLPHHWQTRTIAYSGLTAFFIASLGSGSPRLDFGQKRLLIAQAGLPIPITDTAVSRLA